jgi:Domain of unknown function (DUF6321)
MRAKDILNEDWQKTNKQDKTDGMSQKAVNAYRRENPGSKLKTAVTTKPSKLKKGSKSSKRRSSYCSRSKGQMDMHNISCAKEPDKAICKARRRWNCEEGVEDLDQMLAEAEKTLKNSNPCWKGYKPVGTKKKGGKTVPNCVPVNEEDLGTKPKRKSREGTRPERGHTPVARYKEQDVEEGKASRELCKSSKPDSELGVSNLASCKSQGLRARDGEKSHKLGKSPKSRVKVGGHKIKGRKYGGPLPDWS